MADEKPHLSYSQLETFSRCGHQYERRYILGEKIPPGIAMIRGTGFHKGAQHNLSQKILSREDLPVKDIVGVAIAAFETEIEKGYELGPDEKAKGAAVAIGQAKDDVADMAYCHAKNQAPDYQPVLVETKVRIELPMASHDLVGVIDLADELDRVIDFKTGSRKKSQSDADGSLQLTGYAAMFEEVTGRPANELRLDTVIKTKTKTYRDFLSTARTEADYAALNQRILVMTKAVKAGIFTPTSPGNWCCSPKWCGYFANGKCPYVNAERTAAAEGAE